MRLLCSSYPTHASAVLYPSPLWQQPRRKQERLPWTRGNVSQMLLSMFHLPARSAGRNGSGGLYMSSASSGLGSSQERLWRFVLNAPPVFLAKRHVAPRSALRLRTGKLNRPQPRRLARASSSPLKCRCWSQHWRKKEIYQWLFSLLIKTLLEMSPRRHWLVVLRRHWLVVLLRAVKEWPFKALLLLTVEGKFYKQKRCTCLTSAFVEVVL